MIAWLEDARILSAVNALFTLALVLFAGLQLWRAEMERRERIRAAVGAFWVEYFRLWRVSVAWTDPKLDLLIHAGVFDPQEVLPPDWGATIPLLGAMGAVPARLGGLAYAYAAESSAQAKLAVRCAAALADHDRDSRGTPVENYRRDELNRAFEKVLADAKLKAKLSADTLEDALANAPAWATRMQVDISRMSSGPGRALVERIQARAKATPLWRRIGGRLFPRLLVKRTVEDIEARGLKI